MEAQTSTQPVYFAMQRPANMQEVVFDGPESFYQGCAMVAEPNAPTRALAAAIRQAAVWAPEYWVKLQPLVEHPQMVGREVAINKGPGICFRAGKLIRQ